jgi:trimeric autotransporter adhesin
VSGRVTSGATLLPGVSILVHTGGTLKAATSTDVDGTFAIALPPNGVYELSTEFTGFTRANREVTVGAPPCNQTLDLTIALEPRKTPSTASADALPSAEPRAAGASNGARAPAAARRFESLNVQSDPAAAAVDEARAEDPQDVARLLPQGFSVEAVQSDPIAINGSNDAATLDRGLMNDRSQMINLGQLDPATGQFAQGFGPPEGPGGRGGFGGPGGPGPEARAAFAGLGPGGQGPGGRGGFVLGGRGGRGQRAYQGSATYTFGGSALDSPPYQLRPDVPVTQPQFARNNFGATFGGPLRIPGVYADTNRRTSFQLNYTGSQANNVFDQYATVPTGAQRLGDFSTSPVALIDPATGQAFPGNQIPADRIDPTAAALLPFIPSANLTGATQNYHASTIAHTTSEAVSLRLTQNLSPVVAASGNGRQGGAARGRVGGGGRGGGRLGGPGGGRGTNVMLNAQLQYRHNTTESPNVFADLGSATSTTTFSAPVSLIVRRGRSMQNVSVNLTHSSSATTNGFANQDNVAGLAGIQYPSGASADPNNWGVPNLSFTGFTAARSASATLRSDTRLTTGYTWMHPSPKHQLRIGGEFRLDRSSAEINSNARGSFTFTGRYTSGDAALARGTGADFADFLLGLPQQATLQVGGTSRLRQPSINVFVEDNWQKSSKLTFNLGLRYELARPYAEASNRLANLDVAPGFTSVAPVVAGGVGPFTGVFPSGLLNTDANNVAPRVGVAYRVQPGTIIRGGYAITYNSGSYASIARQLSGQPPFAETETIAAAGSAPLTLAEALLSTTAATTNSWGVDRDYALGMIQTWNSTITRNVTADWMLQAGYTRIKGTDLDILRAPILGVEGAPLTAAQPFIWESSGGRSMMNAATFQVRRRLAHGWSGGLSYTLGKSMDNASSLGAGGPVVAQNDKDLNAEWGLSSFDKRQQVSGNFYLELPWGPNRRWLKDGGTLAAVLGEWSAQFTLTLQSGTPLTARVLGAASDLVRGVNGSLRADYSGVPIALSNPTIDEFFNVAAFTLPAPGGFGDAARNSIIGPGTRQLNGLFQRDIRMGGPRSLTLQVNAINLLNTVQWAAVDTNINSPTFGQVLSARPMRTMTITARLRF